MKYELVTNKFMKDIDEDSGITGFYSDIDRTSVVQDDECRTIIHLSGHWTPEHFQSWVMGYEEAMKKVDRMFEAGKEQGRENLQNELCKLLGVDDKMAQVMEEVEKVRYHI